MPYIKQESRKILDPVINTLLDTLDGHFPDSPGAMNYIISRIVNEAGFTEGYIKINTVIGVLECAKQEFYRRVASQMEDAKLEENGDVY